MAERITKSGKVRKHTDYKQQTKQTAFLGANATKLNGKPISDIMKVLQDNFADVMDIATVKKRCDALDIKYLKGWNRRPTANAVSREDVQCVLDTLDILGDVLLMTIQSSSMAPAERDKQAMRLLGASDCIAATRKKLAVKSSGDEDTAAK